MEPILRLSEINSIRKKLDFIQDQPGLSNLQVSFLRKKTVINSLSLSEFFDKNFSLNVINFKSLDIVERDNQKGKVLNVYFY